MDKLFNDGKNKDEIIFLEGNNEGKKGNTRKRKGDTTS